MTSALVTILVAATWWVSPQGSDDNKGTQRSPWSLQYALSSPDPVRSGDIIRLQPGDYDCSASCKMETVGVRWYALRARLLDNRQTMGYSMANSTLNIMGAGTTLHGVSVVNTSPLREVDEQLPIGISVYGRKVTISDVTVQGSGSGVFIAAEADEAVVRHSIFRQIGWYDTAREQGRGHALYIQGQSRVYDNIIHDVHGYCIQIWGSQDISRQLIRNNDLTKCGRGGIIVGGGQAVKGIAIIGNSFYAESPHSRPALNLIGSVQSYILRNSFVGPVLLHWRKNLPTVFRGNFVYGRGGRTNTPRARIPVVDYNLEAVDECRFYCDFIHRYPDNEYRLHAGNCGCVSGACTLCIEE